MNYNQNNLISIAKRDNNTKRPFLLVNPMQGKHIPVAPSKCLLLFQALADKVFDTKSYTYRHTMIIGFAETATAIGMDLLPVRLFLQTTSKPPENIFMEKSFFILMKNTAMLRTKWSFGTF